MSIIQGKLIIKKSNLIYVIISEIVEDDDNEYT